MGYQYDMPAEMSKDVVISHRQNSKTIGLLSATEKQVHMGCLPLISKQCYLKNSSNIRINIKYGTSSIGIAPIFKVVLKLRKHGFTAVSSREQVTCQCAQETLFVAPK